MAQQWILRKGSKESGFQYVTLGGKRLRAKEHRERIDALRIPPAWREVHVAASPRSGIQAWGLDARGRKQYRYHPRAVQKGSLRKHYRVRQLGKELPKLKWELEKDFRKKGFPKEKVCAGIVLLIAEAFLRVGSDRYERENSTFGITTLRRSHVSVKGDTIDFRYRGKRSIEQWQVVESRKLAEFVRAQLKTPGPRLFRYQRNGEWFNVDSRDVNDYLRDVAEFPYTAKDLRTWGGTVKAATVLADLGSAPNERARNKNVVAAMRFVAADMGHTPAICRKSYVHPVIISRYLRNGSTIRISHPKRSKRQQSPFKHAAEEEALIDFLEEHFPDRRKTRRAP